MRLYTYMILSLTSIAENHIFLTMKFSFQISPQDGLFSGIPLFCDILALLFTYKYIHNTSERNIECRQNVDKEKFSELFCGTQNKSYIICNTHLNWQKLDVNQSFLLNHFFNEIICHLKFMQMVSHLHILSSVILLRIQWAYKKSLQNEYILFTSE